MIAELLADSGAGRPLVYLPGIDGSGQLLLGLTRRLEPSFRVLRLRYRIGSDLSRPPSYASLAESIDRVLAEAGLEEVLVVCESFGGAVGLQLTLDHPGRVAGLAVVNGFSYYARRGRLRLSRFLQSLTTRWMFDLGRRTCVQQALFHPRRDPRALREFLDVRGTWFDPAYKRRMRMIQGLDLRPRLGELSRPVALFASDRDRVVDSVPAAEVMAASIPDVTYEVLPDAGHVVLPLEAEPWAERFHELARRADLSPARGTSPAS